MAASCLEKTEVRGWRSLDGWLDALSQVLARPLRSGLTAFSVAWGVFMLILLLAAGDGLENAMRWNFRDDAINSIWLWGGRTTKAHAGHPEGRRIVLDDGDTELVEALPESGHVTARYIPPGDTRIAHGARVSTFDIRSTHPDHRYLESTQLVSGRFISDRDVAHRRKVAVLGLRVAQFLFPDTAPTAPSLVGEEIRVAGIVFTVVGVFVDEGGEREESIVYLPITTAKAAFGGKDRIDQLMFTVGPPDLDAASLKAADRAIAAVRTGIAARHGFASDDGAALRVRDRVHAYADVQAVFVWLRRFTWLVGLGTVLAAMVGVGNTLLISVKERTRELGLRRALGARRSDLVGMVMQEALLLVSVAGWAGLVAGVGLVELARRFVPPDSGYLRSPDVDLTSVGIAVVAIVGAGVLAGLMPAWQAASIPPVVALQDE